MNPCEEVKPLRGVKRLKRPLSSEEREKLLHEEEAAKIAKCARNTIKAAIVRGQLQAKDLGFGRRHYWRIERGELLRWLGVGARSA